MRSNKLAVAAASLAMAAIGLGGATSSSAPTRFGQIDDARLAKADSEPQNWLAYGGNHLGHRYSALDQINVGNVANLKPAWVFEYDTNRGQETTPIVVDGVAYVTSAWSKVYALNAKTGEQIWAYDPKVPGEAGIKPCCDVINRGAAVYKGRVYSATIDGRLMALDARTGKLVWSTMTVDPAGQTSITGAPRVANGLVFIGNAGGDTGGRGYAGAYSAETGKMVWRFWLTPGKPGVKDNAPSDEIMDKLVQPTWFGPYNEYRGGANVWARSPTTPSSTRCIWPPATAIPGAAGTDPPARGTTCSSPRWWPSTPRPASTAGTTRRPPARAGTSTPWRT